jgi:hypothetical protein
LSRAKIGDISNAELNQLEIDFLEAIDFELYVSKNEYKQWLGRAGALTRRHKADTKAYQTGKTQPVAELFKFSPRLPSDCWEAASIGAKRGILSKELAMGIVEIDSPLLTALKMS